MHCLDERGLTGDSETGDAETGDTKTSESKREREILPYLVLVRSRDFDKQRTKSKLYKPMINHIF